MAILSTAENPAKISACLCNGTELERIVLVYGATRPTGIKAKSIRNTGIVEGINEMPRKYAALRKQSMMKTQQICIVDHCCT